jgi:hypothetical protein
MAAAIVDACGLSLADVADEELPHLFDKHPARNRDRAAARPAS